MMEKMLRGLKSLFVAGGKAGTSRQRGRQNKIGNMLFGSYYLQAFLFNLAAGVLSFVWTIIEQGGLFSLAGDFNSQQITFAMAANDAVKAGNIIWDWSLDLGSNFIGGQMFYVVGNPSFWISLLFPSRYFMYVVGWIYILKYAVAGLTSYACMRRYVRDQQTAVIGSMLYAFCGFMGEDLLFYHFHDVVALFPLLVLTLDGMMLEKKKGPFIFAVCINALVNYFFFIGEVIFMAACPRLHARCGPFAAGFLFCYTEPACRSGLHRIDSSGIRGGAISLYTEGTYIPRRGNVPSERGDQK